MRSESEIGQKSAMSEQLKAQVEDLKLQLSQNDSKLAEYQTERVKPLEKIIKEINSLLRKHWKQNSIAKKVRLKSKFWTSRKKSMN